MAQHSLNLPSHLSEAQVNEALAFYAAHRSEMDAAIALCCGLEKMRSRFN